MMRVVSELVLPWKHKGVKMNRISAFYVKKAGIVSDWVDIRADQWTLRAPASFGVLFAPMITSY